MLKKLFIVAVALIGIAIEPSFGDTAKQAIDQAYNATVEGGISLKFTLWRAANCPNEGNITRGMTGTGADRRCFFCICGSTTPPGTPPGNCDEVACPDTGAGAIATAVANTWNSTSTPTPEAWKSIGTAVSMQVYTVDDGFCYAMAIDRATGRTMKCFAHR